MIIGSMKTIEQASWKYFAGISKIPAINAGTVFVDVKKQHLENVIDDAFKAGVEFAQQWISINDELPKEDGNDYLLRNDKWIHEDYSPNGVRFGFFNSELEGEKWTHVHWSGYSDEYITEHDEPTHWRKINLI
ncbi:hypothetical protein EZS27_009177 [termite gut metagenome]|uniref:Uncharacterized protein n=1 Tax=termite gut metagenome TaxID=433724 RepID=A0A5J4SCY6_9ZZZZ